MGLGDEGAVMSQHLIPGMLRGRHNTMLGEKERAKAMYFSLIVGDRGTNPQFLGQFLVPGSWGITSQGHGGLRSGWGVLSEP